MEIQDTSLRNIQARIGEWAVAKGWSQPLREPRAPDKVEKKLAAIALAQADLSMIAEELRLDPDVSIGRKMPHLGLDAVEALQRAVSTRETCASVKVLAKLALIHTEVSEAAETVFKSKTDAHMSALGKPEGLAPELADIVIRVLQLADDLNIDLVHFILGKLDYNDTRPYKHGKHA